MLLVIALT